ncbi:MAG: ribosomal L7Ae/L30e/S12e/Gadd45 family protein [Candidatus Woesearchaeota archaeon]
MNEFEDNEIKEKEDTKTSVLKEIKDALKNNKAVIGTNETLKLLKQGKILKIFVSYNTSNDVKDDINYYTKISNINVIELDIPNEELGVVCQKPFSISVIGIIK